ncbi:TIGR01906 family membrane protein [Isobaculum melis]|uniref:Integral membrane protein TIGR01906 n=1 Tax=Isobaculum melis TaxID=142588 RepID=A0A1H9QSU0_9LACT|nr:TIGR01906 family membrane protein [Isobaculum melis]SER62773.1 integral membrane protein TIGR01906 [Isobaculum melis]
MKKYTFILGMIGLFFFIITFSIAIVIIAKPLYLFDIGHFQIEELTGMSKEVLTKNYDVLMSYLNFPWQNQLAMPDFPSSAQGLFHFAEVKNLFLLNHFILIVSGIGSFFFIKGIYQTKSSWRLVRPFQIAIVVPVVLLILISSMFEIVFVKFHEIFFNNDAWMFDAYTDPIINALPEGFFMHCFILAFVLMEAQFIIGYFLAKKKMKTS